MALKRKRSSNYQDGGIQNQIDSPKLPESFPPNDKKSKVGSSLKTHSAQPCPRISVASNRTSHYEPNSELFANSRPSPRWTRHINLVKAEVVITTSRKDRSRSSQTTIQNSDYPLTSSHETNINDTSEPATKSTDSSHALLDQMQVSLNARKRAIFKSLQSSKHQSLDTESSINDIALQQLTDLVDGTVTRAEGNSCLLLGPHSSGKSKMIDTCLDNLSTKPIILRLCGWIQTTDQDALREIAFQIVQQVDASLFSDSSDASSTARHSREEEENPFLIPQNMQSNFENPHLFLPSSSSLHSLIPALLTLKRPVVVVLDAFEYFALRPRQSLLYCLLDTVQNCRASAESQGIVVIGITSRVDTIQLLEKRVKSRFSGRTIRTASSDSFESYMAFIRKNLTATSSEKHVGDNKVWNCKWTSNIEHLLIDEDILDIFKGTFDLSRDHKLIYRILIDCVSQSRPDNPFLTREYVLAAVEAQQSRFSHPAFYNLSYPSTCLLIASVQTDLSGHPHFTFEILFEAFSDQLRSSMSAPIQVNGGSIGMIRCTREVLMSAFEGLVAAKIFTPVNGASSAVEKQFVKHRCNLDRDVVKRIVEKSNQVNLSKWFGKTQ